jgi:GTP cyclohydrolase I
LDLVHPRVITDADRERFEGYLGEIFSALGLDIHDPAAVDTPRRHFRALYDATIGYEGDPKILTSFPTVCHGGANCELSQVVEGPIPFFSLCEHHALPYFGEAWVGYVAHEGIIGISKLTRLVRVVTRRFGVQEEMTHEIANELTRMMEPHGVAVYLEAHHLCTQMRGVRELMAKTRTTAFRGNYTANASLRSEFFDVAGLRRPS